MKQVEVVCAVIIKDNKVFICQRGPGKILEGKWEFPGGKVEQNETFEGTIIREIKEELDTVIKPIKYICTVTHTYDNIKHPFHITLHAYICELVSGELTLLEHKDSMWCEIDKLATIDFAEADIPILKYIKENK